MTSDYGLPHPSHAFPNCLVCGASVHDPESDEPCAAPPQPSAPQATAWLIERGQPEHSVTKWWTGDGDRWTTDAYEAQWFRTRQFALEVIEGRSPRWGLVKEPFGRAVEHGFAAPVAPAPQALDVERLIDLWVAAHSSNREGQRAGHEMYAMVEDWWDANRADPYPLPRMSRLPSEEE